MFYVAVDYGVFWRVIHRFSLFLLFFGGVGLFAVRLGRVV